MVTFFGQGCVMRFLRRDFRMDFPQLHVDVCFLLKRLGYSGGLKKVEKILGIHRGDDTDGLDGMDAVRLWREYVNGNERSLQTLLAYNAEDVLNMETLLHFGIEEMRKRTW